MAASTQFYKLFSWGANTYGQLCVGHKEDICIPTEIPFEKLGDLNPAEVYQICGGGGHVAILTESGKVHTCGLNNRGQLGHCNSGDETTLNLIDSIKGKATKLACGWEHTLCLTSDGTLWGWGANNYFQLSCLDVKYVAKPVEIMINPLIRIHVIDIAAGLRHTLAVSDTGEVYVWGSGRECQLGVVDANDKVVEVIATPSPVPLPASRIRKVACGSHHSLALSDVGDLYIWGCNRHGQLALDPSAVQRRSTAVLVPSVYFNEEKIRDVFSGWSHIIAITESGKAFTWGRNDYGQLGRQGIPWTPLPLQVFTHLWQVSPGAEHNIAIADDLKVVSWGWNEHGICGIKSEENVPSPRHVATLQDYSATYVGTGYGSSFAVVKC